MNTVPRVVAWFQMLAGVLTASYAAVLVFTSGANAAAVTVGVALLIVGGWSIVAGAALLRGKRAGWFLSVVLQVLQLPAFAIGSALYRLGLGAFLALGVHMPEIGAASGSVAGHFQVGLGTDFMVSFGTPLEEQYVAVNVVALALLLALLRVRSSQWN